MNTKRPVDRERYLNFPEVSDFLCWLEAKLDPPGGFRHGYYLAKAKRAWECSCLYEAYERYWWPYKQYSSVHGKEIAGSSFEDSFAYMSCLARQFREAVSNGDAKKTNACALEMLKWGGVLNHNRERIIRLGGRSAEHFKRIGESLDLNRVTLDGNEQIFINSGFSKLYFLLIDNFIMYDGRVGAALGLLGRVYAEENNLAAVPPMIEFSFGSGKTAGTSQVIVNRRDPSSARYRFPEYTGNPGRHLTDNIKASWLLKCLADRSESRFKLLAQTAPLNDRLTALQSALFMVGYDVRCSGWDEKAKGSKAATGGSEPDDYPLLTVGRGYRFRVDYNREQRQLRFSYPLKSNGKRRAPDYFGLDEVAEICRYLERNFAGRAFPLANNVQKLSYRSEQPGLGMAIRSLPGADVLKAQASSYLGPFLASFGVFKLVNSRPTTWELVVPADTAGEIIDQKLGRSSQRQAPDRR